MSFKDQDWTTREQSLGDRAESRYCAWAERNRLGYVRFGLERPPLRMYELPTRIRYTPDFLMGRGFIEAQGFGRDQTAKMKQDKLGALHWWNDLHPTWLYWWDSHYERECFMHVLDFDKLLPQSTWGTFDNGTKPYHALSADLIFAHGQDAPS